MRWNRLQRWVRYDGLDVKNIANDLRKSIFQRLENQSEYFEAE